MPTEDENWWEPILGKQYSQELESLGEELIENYKDAFDTNWGDAFDDFAEVTLFIPSQFVVELLNHIFQSHEESDNDNFRAMMWMIGTGLASEYHSNYGLDDKEKKIIKLFIDIEDDDDEEETETDDE